MNTVRLKILVYKSQSREEKSSDLNTRRAAAPGTRSSSHGFGWDTWSPAHFVCPVIQSVCSQTLMSQHILQREREKTEDRFCCCDPPPPQREPTASLSGGRDRLLLFWCFLFLAQSQREKESCKRKRKNSRVSCTLKPHIYAFPSPAVITPPSA